MEQLHTDIKALHQKLQSLRDDIKNQWPTAQGLDYLQVKNHALITYTKMELFFILLKLQNPHAICDHPVFKQLVRYRTLLERIRPLDRKMQYQVDKMLKIVTLGADNWDEALHFGPKPDHLIANEAQSSHAATDDDENSTKKMDTIYRAPRLAAVHYEEEEKEQAKQAKREERNRRRLEKSQILSELREEFSERPMELQISGQNPVDKIIAKEEAEQKEFEESRFVRLVTSRKDKVRKRRREQDATRADSMASIDNFAGVQDILASKSKTTRGATIPKIKLGGKVGGIFAHVHDQLSSTEKSVKTRSGKAQISNTQHHISESTNHVDDETTFKKSGKKQKVKFTNVFS
nr:neuroguidinlike protein putative [Albugo laibachii Nc14]|eukprot:CCA24401.1 neuroguidinlike protein putative [Albugo laibachii Nc14]